MDYLDNHQIQLCFKMFKILISGFLTFYSNILRFLVEGPLNWIVYPWSTTSAVKQSGQSLICPLF